MKTANATAAFPVEMRYCLTKMLLLVAACHNEKYPHSKVKCVIDLFVPKRLQENKFIISCLFELYACT
jgi:hypothetical protein